MWHDVTKVEMHIALKYWKWFAENDSETLHMWENMHFIGPPFILCWKTLKGCKPIQIILDRNVIIGEIQD